MSGPHNFCITRYHLNSKFGPVRMAAPVPAGSLGNHDRFPIWRTPYYRLGRSGWTPYGCTCLRYEGREEEPYRVCIHRPTNSSRRAPGRRNARRGVLRRERSWAGRGDGGGGGREGERKSERGAGEGGIYRREAGVRAYDIKHYNYYLNSSRMAPGVAAPSSSSFHLSRHTRLFLSPRFSPSRLRLPSRAFHLSPLLPPSRPRALVWPRSHALFALVYRSPLVDRSFCFFEVALLLLRPRVGATLLVSSRSRASRTVATIDPIL